MALSEVDNVTFYCTINSTDRVHWTLKFLDSMNLSTRDGGDMVILSERGVAWNNSRGSGDVTIPVVLKNNCTLIRCSVVTDRSTMFSKQMKLTVAGEIIACCTHLLRSAKSINLIVLS